MQGSKILVIDIDLFIEPVLDAYLKKRKKAVDFVRLLYEAADLNEDGFL